MIRNVIQAVIGRREFFPSYSPLPLSLTVMYETEAAATEKGLWGHDMKGLCALRLMNPPPPQLGSPASAHYSITPYFVSTRSCFVRLDHKANGMGIPRLTGMTSSLLQAKWSLPFFLASSIAVASWTVWNDWSDCSKTCGQRGVQSRYRICKLPENASQRILCEVSQRGRGETRVAYNHGASQTVLSKLSGQQQADVQVLSWWCWW